MRKSLQNIKFIALTVFITGALTYVGMVIMDHPFAKTGDIYATDNSFKNECIKISVRSGAYIKVVNSKYGINDGSAMLLLSGMHIASEQERKNCGW